MMVKYCDSYLSQSNYKPTARGTSTFNYTATYMRWTTKHLTFNELHCSHVSRTVLQICISTSECTRLFSSIALSRDS